MAFKLLAEDNVVKVNPEESSFKTSLHRGIFNGKNEDIVNNNLGHVQLHLEKVLCKKGS